MFLVIKEKYFISFRFVSSFSMFVIKRKISYRACMVTPVRARANGSVYFCPSITHIKNSRLFEMTVGGG